MDATQATSISISLIYTTLQAIIAAFLFHRMRAARLKELQFVFLTFTSATLGALLGIAWTGFRIIFNPLVAIFILPFVEATFYRKKQSRYKSMLATSLALYAYVIVARLAWQFGSGEEGLDAIYYSYILAILAIYLACYGWFFASCIETRKKISTSKGIEPWVKFRYVLLIFSCASAIATAVFPLAYPSHESFHEQAAVMKVVMAASNLLFSITSLTAWFMPAWLKRVLNERSRDSLVFSTVPMTAIASRPVSEKLGSALIMSIIDHLGNRLAPRINKSPGAVKGLLLLSLEAAEQQHGVTGIDFTLLHDAIVDDVKSRLDQLGIPNVDAIINELEHDVIDIQSLLVVGKF